MNHKDLNNWIMYYEIQKLQRLGFSISKIANHLTCNFRKIRDKYPRYTRDHLLMIRETLNKYTEGGEIPDKALKICIKNDLVNGTEFRDVFYCLWSQNIPAKQTLPTVKLLDKENLLKMNETPQTSNIDDYESIINN